MSMVLQPNQNFEEIAQYTVIMAVAVARAMDALAFRQKLNGSTIFI